MASSQTRDLVRKDMGVEVTPILVKVDTVHEAWGSLPRSQTVGGGFLCTHLSSLRQVWRSDEDCLIPRYSLSLQASKHRNLTS